MKSIRENIRISILLIFLLHFGKSTAYIPVPDHVVVVVFENHAYQQIVGSSAAPYINSLLSDPKCALFTQSYGLSHPSQPNYLQLFSGSNQGITDNNVPDFIPFTNPNLGASLITAGRSFTGYSEGLPAIGANDSVSGLYARKHNPWVNWQGAALNAVPATSNQPLTAFPSNYSTLPTVSFVVPNLINGMHDGTDPSRITTGDTWLQSTLDAYIQWAKSHNSLLVLTFDEDEGASGQHILTFIIGDHVVPGSYSNSINHYNVLRMLEDMYTLPHAGAAASATTIDYCFSACAQLPTISANGPLTFCQGNSVTLTASSGASYLWSTGATTNTITVSTAGNFSVTITDAIGCAATSAAVSTSLQSFSTTGTVFSESIGNVGGTTAITAHESANGFDNDLYTMSGTGDIRSSSPSLTSNYPTASGQANVFLTNTSGKNFIISGINTSGLMGLQLSFGILKSTTASNGSDLQVLVSSDGVNYTQVAYPALPTGSGTAVWTYRTVTGTIPAVPNLR
ncbi:MAG TPA: alkaline phosphatase family protein, partial [Bacteroidia bacterium]|nr:alkaline phosphatase family protein [Bacteroidia bacterium]